MEDGVKIKVRYVWLKAGRKLSTLNKKRNCQGNETYINTYTGYWNS